ncbi:MAG: hypothetical protein II399_01685 [Lachnospiraceae bacterium]|nr:hypothetical protein [Lachnospiraceae bacterium]
MADTFKGMEITPEMAAEMSATLKSNMDEKQYKKLIKFCKMLNTFNIPKNLLTKAISDSSQSQKVQLENGLDIDDMSDMIELMCIIAKYEK